MKKNHAQRGLLTAQLGPYRLTYRLLTGPDGTAGVSCHCYDGTDLHSTYENARIFSRRESAEDFNAFLAENAIFPAHIPEILSDLAGSDVFPDQIV